MVRKNLVKTLVVPAAGAGTRLLPLTSAIPKEMLRLVDKPAIYYIVKEAYLSGIENIILIINPWKKSVREYLSGKNGKSLINEFPKLHFSFIYTDNLYGDGYAISLASKMVKEDIFAVAMADMLSPPEQPFISQLIKIHKKHNLPAISVEPVPRNLIDHYGVIKPKGLGKRLYQIEDIVEKPSIEKAPSNLALTGKYVLPKVIFSYLDVLLKNRKPKEEVRLADALKEYVKGNDLLALACQGQYFDIGNKAAFLKTEFLFAMRDKEFGKDFKNFIAKLKW